MIALSMHHATAGDFPWKSSKPLLWQATKPSAMAIPFSTYKSQSYLPLAVHLSPNGSVKIMDRGGLISLRIGLPGRPQKVWRDCGNKVADIFAPILFSRRSPLKKNLNYILSNILDFRSNLEGLLWIICDDESTLTIINPSTSQVVYLPLPNGQNLDLAFHPDHIEVTENPPADGHKKIQASWSLYWLTLIPNFIQLGKYSEQHQKIGTALAPFGK